MHMGEGLQPLPPSPPASYASVISRQCYLTTHPLKVYSVKSVQSATATLKIHSHFMVILVASIISVVTLLFLVVLAENHCAPYHFLALHLQRMNDICSSQSQINSLSTT